MAQAKRKNRWIGYTVYGLLLGLVLLYYKFPEEALGDYFRSSLQKADSDLLVSFEDLSLSFPPGLKITEPVISLKGGSEQDVFLVQTLRIRPGVLSFLKMDPEYRFTCSAYNGTISGSVRIKKRNEGSSIHTSIELEDVHIEDDSRIAGIIKNNVGGVFNGTLSYEGETASPIRGSGEGSLFLSNGSFVVTPPVLSIKSIRFNEVTLKMSLADQKLILSDVDIKGKDILGKASGSILLNEVFMESRLNLEGTMEPLSDLFAGIPDASEAMRLIRQHLKGGKLPFRILGTLNDPRIQLL